MRFSELDEKMRIYETAHDVKVMPGLYMIARLDGRGFHKLTEEMNSKRPFCSDFSKYMVETMYSLIEESGFEVSYGYTQSDEISLLFKKDTEIFNRKERKYNSILAGIASANFSLNANRVVCFDCRVIQIPNKEIAIDYFRWRQADAARNCLNSYCYWKLRGEGFTYEKTTEKLNKMPNKDKHDLLMGYGINFNDVEPWKKNGIGMFYVEEDKIGINPITKEEVSTIYAWSVRAGRRYIKIKDDLEYGENYGKFLESIIE